jgi:hypothetical protein
MIFCVHQHLSALAPPAPATGPPKTLPRIVAVAAGNPPKALRLCWDERDESLADVSGMMETFRVYEPLRHALKLFRQVTPSLSPRLCRGD